MIRVKRVTVQELIDSALDRAYSRASSTMLRGIIALSTSPMSDMQRALLDFEQETRRLTEKKERLSDTNKYLKNALKAFGVVMAGSARLIRSTAPTLEKEAQRLAVKAVTAKVFQTFADDMIAQGRNPLSDAPQETIIRKALRDRGEWNAPSPAEMARTITDSAEWADKMAYWGQGYAELLTDTILQGIADGNSPYATASQMRHIAQNMPYHSAENLTRTLQLNSYREATVEMEQLNGEFIQGKIRIAHLDQRTCLVPDTLIETSVGSKKIQDVKIGDLVKTHKGTYEKVADVMSKDYSRQTVNIKTKDGHLECTDDHPVLILREGYCYWVLAKDIQVGDSLFITSENGSYSLDHISGDTSVKWSVGNPNDVVSIGVQSDNLSSVGIGTFGMPINTVNFKSNIQVWNKEVHCISVYFGLLLKHYSKLFKTHSDILLWFALTAILMITTWATKLFAFSVFAGTKPVFLSTIQALIHKDGTPANLGAIYPFVLTRSIEFFATSFADKFPPLHILPLAIYGAIMITICVGLWNSEFFSTPDTSLVTSSTLKFTFSGAVIKVRPFLDLAWSKFKLFTTSLADKLLPVSLLPDSPALSGATHPTRSTFDLGSQNSKLFFANPANKVGKFSAHVVLSSNLSNRNYNGKVYNLEVENEHTYLANGFVVHNCLSCIALHGTKLQPGQKVEDHYRGRCTEYYQVPGEPEFPEYMQVDSTPGNRKFEKFQKGEDWFANLSPERRAQQFSFIRSPGKLNAYNDGMPLSLFVGDHIDPVFGHQFIENTLTKAVGNDAEKYYVRNVGRLEMDKTNTLKDFESSIANKDIEYAGLYSRDGTFIFSEIGTKDSVGFTAEQLDQMTGGILTHNHPNERSFSIDDIRLFLNNNLAEVRVVTDEFIYSMINDANISMTPKAIRRLYNNSLIEAIKNNPDGTDDELFSDAWYIFANAVGLKYKKDVR